MNGLSVLHISTGRVSGCLADLKIFFAAALRVRVSKLIFEHNHPSENMTPSEEDKRFTKRLVAVGILLSITVPDRMIVKPRSSYSFADNGLIA